MPTALVLSAGGMFAAWEIGVYLTVHDPASSALVFSVSSTLRLSRRPRLFQ